jgi:RimJ/RimL family protein N-acetyltransferase
LFGHVDKVGSSISGWVSDGTADRLRVLCRIDDTWEVTVEAGEFRPDVRDAGYGDGYSGFKLTVPEALINGQERRMELLVPERSCWTFPGFPSQVVLGMPTVRIFRLTAEHESAHAEFWARQQREFGVVTTSASRNLYHQTLLSLLGQGNSAALAIEANGGIVGICTLSGKTGYGYQHVAVLGIMLLVGYRGKRLGERLMAAALECARELNLRRVELTVNPANQPARRLYQRFGFSREGVLRDYHQVGQQYSDEILKALILPNTGTR